VTTSIPVSARFTVAISSASPAIFSSFGWSTGILRAANNGQLAICVLSLMQQAPDSIMCAFVTA
jgi:hypothetical protein